MDIFISSINYINILPMYVFKHDRFCLLLKNSAAIFIVMLDLLMENKNYHFDKSLAIL